jgi:hypothetical protein
MKDNILVGVLIGFIIVILISIISMTYQNFKPEPTIEERIHQCRQFRMKNISITMNGKDSTVNCREE